MAHEPDVALLMPTRLLSMKLFL